MMATGQFAFTSGGLTYYDGTTDANHDGKNAASGWIGPDRSDSIRASLLGGGNRVLATTLGGSVSAGMPIAEIVPSEVTRCIETMVRPSGMANVRIGPDTIQIRA